MCTETTTFHINNGTKNYKKIIDLGPYKGLGGSIYKQLLSIICHMQPIKKGVLTKNFEN